MLWLLQILGIVIFFGAVIVSGWNLKVTWSDDARWQRKVMSLLVFLSTLLLFYVAWIFNLMALTVNY